MTLAQLRAMLSRLPAQCDGWAVAVLMDGAEREASALQLWPPDADDVVWPEGVVYVTHSRWAPDPASGGTVMVPGAGPGT